MSISRLQFQGLRNLGPIKIAPHRHFNLIVGDNASGKSSFLEGIHFLGLGRSFRTGQAAKVVQRGQTEFVVFGEVDGSGVGLRWQRGSGIEAKVKGQKVHSLAQLPALLPLQLITPEAVTLISGGPKERRSFIDWGVFHVEPRFHMLWRRYRRLLKQRNAALKRGVPQQQVAVWDAEYVHCSEQITAFRHAYIADFLPLVTQYLSRFVPELDFKIEFYQGWEQGASLLTLLTDNFERDQHLGFTQAGPHKAELKIKTDGVLAAQHLSRGQQKLVVCALRLAQGIHLQQQVGSNNCIFLIDDFSSELDNARQALLADMLLKSDAQLFITGINKDDLKLFQQDEYKLFHVEQGDITERQRGAYD